MIFNEQIQKVHFNWGEILILIPRLKDLEQKDLILILMKFNQLLPSESSGYDRWASRWQPPNGENRISSFSMRIIFSYMSLVV